MPTYAYRFATHWTTTDEELVDYVERFVVSDAELKHIVSGDMPDEVMGVEDPVVEEVVQEEVVIDETPLEDPE